MAETMLLIIGCAIVLLAAIANQHADSKCKVFHYEGLSSQNLDGEQYVQEGYIRCYNYSVSCSEGVCNNTVIYKIFKLGE